MTKENEPGRTEMVYLSRGQFEMAERVRKQLGFSKSAFYRYCIIRFLEQMSVLSTKTKEELVPTP
jgi:hypothetical protein